MVYQWKSASRIKADAKKAGELFERLESSVGLTAKTLLDASRPEDTPLHGEFEWDDSAAAEAYRETQAAYLIRMLCIAPEEKAAEPVRAFFQTELTSGYESIFRIIKSEEKRPALLDLALKELLAFQKKYQMLTELAGVFSEIEKVSA